MEKNFRTWLEGCHRDLDKTTMYEELVPPAEQSQLRKKYGQNATFFHRMSDSSRTIEVWSQGVVNEFTFALSVEALVANLRMYCSYTPLCTTWLLRKNTTLAARLSSPLWERQLHSCRSPLCGSEQHTALLRARSWWLCDVESSTGCHVGSRLLIQAVFETYQASKQRRAYHSPQEGACKASCAARDVEESWQCGEAGFGEKAPRVHT